MLSKLFKKTILASALVVAAGAGYAAETIKIGSVLSVTGPAAFLGDPELKTLQLYIEKINTEGGLLGRKLELVYYDDGTDAGIGGILDVDAVGVIARQCRSARIDAAHAFGTPTDATASCSWRCRRRRRAHVE